MESLTGGMGMGSSQGGALDQKAGILQMLSSIENDLAEFRNSIQTVASQYPSSSQDSRAAIEAIESARSKLIGLLTTILSQTTEPGPEAPRMAG